MNTDKSAIERSVMESATKKAIVCQEFSKHLEVTRMEAARCRLASLDPNKRFCVTAFSEFLYTNIVTDSFLAEGQSRTSYLRHRKAVCCQLFRGVGDHEKIYALQGPDYRVDLAVKSAAQDGKVLS
jgi:hypothetical protein